MKKHKNLSRSIIMSSSVVLHIYSFEHNYRVCVGPRKYLNFLIFFVLVSETDSAGMCSLLLFTAWDTSRACKCFDEKSEAEILDHDFPRARITDEFLDS